MVLTSLPLQRTRRVVAVTAITTVSLSTLFIDNSTVFAADKWQGYIEAEGKYSKQRSIGEGGLFIPLWQDDTDLLFTDLRGKFDDNDSQEFNLGLGYRTILNEDWIVGGYGFYDRRRSPTGNHYNQATLGAEAFTENLDARFNVYIPESTENTLGAGGTVGSISGGQFQIQTMSGSTERALPGFDAEIGYKFDLTSNWNLTTTVGGFYFDADDYDEVAGPRGRVELAYDDIPFLSEGSRFTLGFESQHDDVRGTQTFGLARLRIPFSQFIPGKTEKRAPLTRLEKRMTTRIVRDVDIVAGEGSGGIVSAETAEVTTAGGTNVSAVTIIKAGDDITTEITNAGDNAFIVISGNITTGTGVNARAGQTITGAGQTITLTGSTSGETISYQLPGSAATITNANNTATTFSMANNTHLSDITISGGIVGIHSANTNVSITNVTVENSVSYGIATNGGSGTFDNVNTSNSGTSGYYQTVGTYNISNSVFDSAPANVVVNGGTLTLNNSRVSNSTNILIGVDDSAAASSFTMNNTSLENVNTGIFGVLIADTATLGAPSVAGLGNTMTGTGGTPCFAALSTTGSIAFTNILGGAAGNCP